MGEIIARFEKKGMVCKGLKTFQTPKSVAEEHYKDLSDKPFFGDLVDYICSGPVVCMVWEGPGVVKSARLMIGATNPLESAPGTIRGDLAVEVGEFLFGYFWLFLVFLVIFVWAFRMTSCFVYRAKRHSRIRLCGIRGARDWPVVRRRRRAPGLRGDHDPVGARVSGLLGFVSSCTRCESNIRLV